MKSNDAVEYVEDEIIFRFVGGVALLHVFVWIFHDFNTTKKLFMLVVVKGIFGGGLAFILELAVLWVFLGVKRVEPLFNKLGSRTIFLLYLANAVAVGTWLYSW